MEDITILIAVFLTYFFTQIIHEFGHYLPCYLWKLNPIVEYDKFYLPCAIYHKSYGEVYKDKFITSSGIIIGLIPIILFIFIFYSEIGKIFFIYMLIHYIFISCSADIYKLRNLDEVVNKKV